LSFEWKVVKLQDVCEKITDGSHHSPKSVEHGFLMASVKDMTYQNFDLSGCRRIAKEDYQKLVANGCKPELNDVLIAKDGNTLLKYVFVNREDRELVLLSSIAILRPNMRVLNPYYLRYYLTDPKTKKLLLQGYSSGSAIPRVVLKDFKQLPIPLPSLEEQRAIADQLSILDDKIELNNAINKNLEEIAQALFKRWFVDFEFPNENGEPYKSSGGEFEESELGLIPKGWKQGTISELGEVAGGATPSKKNEDFYTVRGIPWITPKDLSKTNNKYISRGEIDITQKGFSNSSVKLLPKGAVLFSSRAPIGYIAIAKNEVTTNQGFKSVIPFKHVGSEFVYYLLKSNVETIESRASGSTFKEISGTEMKRVPVLIPTENVLAKFNEIVEPIGRLTQKCEEENEDLTQIRDTLLPKLMSGEIRVPVEQDHSVPDLPMVAESNTIYQP
jgi:type I restriction enzyme S subunit